MLSGSNDDQVAAHYAVQSATVADQTPSAESHNSYLPKIQVDRASCVQLAYSRWLQLYLCAVILCNFGLLFLDGNGGDIGYWQDWIKQLSTSGYANFNGNYPPLYIHWLYIAGKFYNFLAMPVENNIFLKYLSQLPVLLCHLLLTYFISVIAKKYAKSELHFHSAMVLTVFNPAILFNGPIWGQIDIIPLIPVVGALLAGISDNRKIFMAPIYTLALLTKFQMIAFAPAFAILFFRDYRIHLIGAILCIPTIALAFLPSIITHSFIQSFKLAYIDVLHQYGATTMGAANIWILLTGNAAPDNIVLFGIAPESPLATIFTAKHFGMITFFIVCLCVFSKGMYTLVLHKNPQTEQHFPIEIVFYFMICTVAFFTLLPAMHERYLLPGVIIALLYYAMAPTKIIYPIAFAFISAFNLTMCMGIKTSSVWPSISWIMLAAFLYGFFELIWGEKWQAFVNAAVTKIRSINYLSIWLLIIGIVGMTYGLYEKTHIRQISLLKNQYLLTTVTPTFAIQDYGNLRTNLSINGNVLTIGGIRYANGFGTHANSTIEFSMPHHAKTFSFLAGLDNEVESAAVRFSVWGDDKLLWQSPIHYGAEKNLDTVTIDINHINRLSLKVSGVNGIGNDHADWVNPVITLADD